MGSSTPNSGLRFPVSGDAPNVPQDVQNLATDLDLKVAPAFASTGLRDSTITSPQTGQWCTVAGVAYVYRSGWHVLVDDAAFAWTSVSMSTGWTFVSSGVQAFRYRRFAGQIQFDGFGFYTGTIGTTHVQLTATIPAVAAALASNVSTYASMSVYNTVALGTNTFLEALPDGRLFVKAAANIVNPVINFGSANPIADLSVG